MLYTNTTLSTTTTTIQQLYRTTMTLKNTGNVMAEYSFVPKNDETEVSKSWLKFNPMDGILAPEESVEVEVRGILNLEEAYEVATMNNNVREREYSVNIVCFKYCSTYICLYIIKLLILCYIYIYIYIYKNSIYYITI